MRRASRVVRVRIKRLPPSFDLESVYFSFEVCNPFLDPGKALLHFVEICRIVGSDVVKSLIVRVGRCPNGDDKRSDNWEGYLKKRLIEHVFIIAVSRYSIVPNTAQFDRKVLA